MIHSLMCDSCSKWIHYYCSDVPVYILKCFAKTKRKYDCKECADVKYKDSDWENEAKSNIVVQEQFLVRRIKFQTENQTLLNNRESKTEENSVASASSPTERSEYVNEGTPINLSGNTLEDMDLNLALQSEET